MENQIDDIRYHSDQICQIQQQREVLNTIIDNAADFQANGDFMNICACQSQEKENTQSITFFSLGDPETLKKLKAHSNTKLNVCLNDVETIEFLGIVTRAFNRMEKGHENALREIMKSKFEKE